MNRLAIVVPCYNEEEIFESTNTQLIELLNSLIKKRMLSRDSYILYVNDGSKDNTWELIKQAHKNSPNVNALSFAENRGHQNAVYAGLMFAKDNADFSISIDADLQDDINVIEEMINKFYSGSDIVYGVRNNRESDTRFKRFTAQAFYRLMNWMGAKTVYNHADFRLMSKKAMEELSLYEETHLFLRGIVPELGLNTDCVYYARKERTAGESKYPLNKMISFALNGITSFSVKPLNLIFDIGLFGVVFSLIAIIYSLVKHGYGETITGWTSIFVSIWFIGGVQLCAIGVVGQYVGKTFIETKKRPRYYINDSLVHSERKKKV